MMNSTSRFDTVNWTPRALQVFSTAKVIAGTEGIPFLDLLFALELGQSVASTVIRNLEISASAIVGRPNPLDDFTLRKALYNDDFEASVLRFIKKAPKKEAKSMGSHYLGTEHVLVALAHDGVFDLPYEKIREEVIRELTPDSSGEPGAGGNE